MAAPQTKMIYDLQDADLSVVLTQGRLVAEEAKRTFGPLSAEQINWKPGEAEWSIGQCFDHLIISNRPYFTIIEEIGRGHRRQSGWERMPLLPRLCYSSSGSAFFPPYVIPMCWESMRRCGGDRGPYTSRLNG